jgi:hypothetical protein
MAISFHPSSGWVTKTYSNDVSWSGSCCLSFLPCGFRTKSIDLYLLCDVAVTDQLDEWHPMAGACNSWPRCKLSNRNRVERALCRSASTIALWMEVGAAERGTIVRSSVCCMSGIQCEVFMFVAMRPSAVCTAESEWTQDSQQFPAGPSIIQHNPRASGGKVNADLSRNSHRHLVGGVAETLGLGKDPKKENVTSLVFGRGSPTGRATDKECKR